MSEQVNPLEKTYRVYLYQHLKYSWTAVFERSGDEAPPVMEDYVRISEGVEVNFPRLTQDDGIQEALKSLDKAEHKARMDLARALSDIADKRASLLSLTHQPESV